jgi:hypothetical protein
MKSIFIAASIAILFFISGCSSIVNGQAQTITINSNVSDAQVTVNGVIAGRTPFTGMVKRAGQTVVSVSKDGYVTKTITLDTSIEPIFWGNIIIGGVVGSTTDLATGSMYKYAPGTIQVDLEKKSI